MTFQNGDLVRIRGDTLIYKVLAVTRTMITIIIMNPQPDGQHYAFNDKSIQAIDESRLEKIVL
ncbi:hypothetical protein B0T19DRAFT_442723 [Cercophora scortea]|uniref:Uncharacterized protein n=1 Tax=Cercophora scortea TaxID=314031 RepID=A0AAE0IDW5_9PEZI|nr:hypothetical protein B0T19DRAFT_442723 [Cercophora scortea]